MAVRDQNIKLGVASRTETPDLARQMLTYLHIQTAASDSTNSPTALSMFDYLEMYSGSKTNHFKQIHKRSGVAYKDILFFDDEPRNSNVEDLGVTMQLVRGGVTHDQVDAGVKRWRERNGRWKSKAEEREG